MPHSHHSHSGQFCRHAKDQLEDVIQEAIRQGFEVFGLSEHAPRYRMEDLFPEESDLTPTDLSATYQSFLTLASSLRTKYALQISLLVSIETDYITPLDLSGLSTILLKHQEIDYVVGSVHHVNGISIDFDRPTCDRTNPNLLPTFSPSEEMLRPFLNRYFDAQFELIELHQPEVLGHIDLCLLWTPEISLKKMKGVREKLERNIRAVIAYGGLFEANAAAIRKGWGTSYPCRDILRLIKSLGGRICLSDDSHGVSYVGLNYLKMRDYLISEQIDEIWYLEPSSTSPSYSKEGSQQTGPHTASNDNTVEESQIVGKRGRVVARKVQGWAEHPFWKKLEAAQGECTS
ncbi:histidinol-phosphatase (PHP family) [Kwoniella heveanensis BCC8398]|uniref:Histidinol-phosphatase n=1 Tax=Kwoniella heveanensis BCC8398 TaxID=1296120 RepID=A0A1B9GP44_9TREE|nr:histidinol-phosphatase (PHP family) [Kwoniella heveanensis BCC8398]